MEFYVTHTDLVCLFPRAGIAGNIPFSEAGIFIVPVDILKKCQDDVHLRHST